MVLHRFRIGSVSVPYRLWVGSAAVLCQFCIGPYWFCSIDFESILYIYIYIGPVSVLYASVRHGFCIGLASVRHLSCIVSVSILYRFCAGPGQFHIGCVLEPHLFCIGSVVVIYPFSMVLVIFEMVL